jgi:hypothetical protein
MPDSARTCRQDAIKGRETDTHPVYFMADRSPAGCRSRYGIHKSEESRSSNRFYSAWNTSGLLIRWFSATIVDGRTGI